MNKIITTVFLLAAWTGLFAQRTTLPNTANQTPSNKNLKNLNGQVIEGRLVVNDSCWLNGAQIVVPNGNVGIGTVTPEAKLHVAISDTTGIEIAHFENNLSNAIITLHSHADSSAIILLQSNGYQSGIGIEGNTKELKLLNGLTQLAIAIDTLGNITIPDLAGSGTRLVTASATGVVDAASVANLGIPHWVKYVVRYGDFDTTALTKTIELFTLPQDYAILSSIVDIDSAFAAPGIGSCALGAGFLGIPDVISPAVSSLSTNIFQYFPIDAVDQASADYPNADTPIYAKLDGDVNLSTLTAGKATYWFLISKFD